MSAKNTALTSPEPPVPASGAELIKTFENPTTFYRGKPFWSWNGKLEKNELLRQATVLKEMGFGGYFMHSRVGLATEYLGDEWFSLINDLADESVRLEMQAFLYDEDRWPSGSAGGLAAIKESNRMKYLRLQILKPSEFHWDDNLVAAFACKLNGLDFMDCQRLDKTSSANISDGEAVLAFSIDIMRPHPFYNGSAYIDTMDPAAVADFIKMTNEQYLKRCSKRIGTSIQGIFTDEPHRGMIMSSFGQGGIDPEYSIPWTPKLPELFRARFGYDLLDKLPDIFLRREGARISPVKWHYVEEIQTLFLQNYLKQIQDWCHANNMIFTGHVLHEDNLVAQVVPNGSMLRNYEYMDTPGMDQLTEGNQCYWNPVQVASVAHQLGRRQVLSELYGCTGWQMSFRNYRDVGGWQALLGVNLRCPHLSWYTMKGESKRDYPASINCQSSWWPEWKNLETYFARFNVVMERGEPERSLLVLDPIESVWAQIGLEWCNGLSAGTPEIQRLEANYQDVFHWLQDANVDFDYGNEDIIHRYGKVIEGPSPVLQVGKACYRAVLVTGMETIRGTTLDLLQRFVKAGGNVVVAGAAPGYVNASPSLRAAEMAKNWVNVPLDRKACAEACKSASKSDSIHLSDPDVKEMQDVYCQIRRENGAIWFIVMNMNRNDARPSLSASLRGSGAVEEWNLLTGERYQIPARKRDGWTEIDSGLTAGETRVFRLVPSSKLPFKPVLINAERIPATGPFEYHLQEPNVCLLDRARWRIDDGEWQGEDEVLRIDHELRNRFGIPQRGGEMVQPWYAARHLPAPRDVCKLEMAYDFYIDQLPARSIELAMEDIDRWDVGLNGVKLDPASSPGFWIDIAFKRLPIPDGALKTGLNTVTLSAKFRSDLDIETLYLTGNFGVKLDGTKRTLCKLPEKLSVGSVVEQGLPFYGAGITYHIPIPDKCNKAKHVSISTPKFEAACIMVGNRMIAWEPYQENIDCLYGDAMSLALKVVLTRRNTFGPVHENPIRNWAYHPGSFHSTGDGWRDEYLLLPNGLLDAPEFVIQREEKQ